ncbi:SHOCT domain-containing protein [Kitasatospora sp. GP82]|uniref:SHOCT domain-containing protein n=1 Tax=Kitasatospora sp. GP82 TaxID=3035089 RepID=UPI00247695CF|nr:SHOCT domain-containing protein [Kitasatospora sp. GP82]MDH6124037.1 putative membrane protein [Kitasatospora sp. GP82]
MMYWHDHGMDGWGFGLLAISMLIFWGLIIFGVVALARYLGRAPQHRPTAWSAGPPPGRPSPERPSPEQLLAERFARGEIDADEYRHRLEVLRSSRGPTPG